MEINNVKLADPIEKRELREIEEKMKEWSIVLYNDEVNSFDEVISLLIIYCEHEYLQAEQCALIAHLQGKYPVKRGSYDELQPIAEALAENGLTVDLE